MVVDDEILNGSNDESGYVLMVDQNGGSYAGAIAPTES